MKTPSPKAAVTKSSCFMANSMACDVNLMVGRTQMDLHDLQSLRCRQFVTDVWDEPGPRPKNAVDVTLKDSGSAQKAQLRSRLIFERLFSGRTTGEAC